MQGDVARCRSLRFIDPVARKLARRPSSLRSLYPPASLVPRSAVPLERGTGGQKRWGLGAGARDAV